MSPAPRRAAAAGLCAPEGRLAAAGVARAGLSGVLGTEPTHGPPLGFASCNPPAQASGNLTVGTPDANGQAANSVGSVRFAVVAGDPATGADEADVAMSFSLTDVRVRSTLADYTGQLAVHCDRADHRQAATAPVPMRPRCRTSISRSRFRARPRPARRGRPASSRPASTRSCRARDRGPALDLGVRPRARERWRPGRPAGTTPNSIPFATAGHLSSTLGPVRRALRLGPGMLG